MTICRIDDLNGRPTMFINGKPRFPMAFISYLPEQFRYRNMAEAGIHFFSLSVTLGDRWFNCNNPKVRLPKKGLWRGPGKIDFAPLEESIKEILKVDPNAYIFPRIYCDSPEWWDELHPEELNILSDGTPLRQSFSSLRWREDTAEILKEIARFVAKAPWGDRIIGYHIAAGGTEEWAHNRLPGTYGDYSPCAQRRFREWMKERYGIERDIRIPSVEERKRGDLGDFLDPEKSRLVIAYNEFYSNEIVDSALHLCKAVKEETNGNLLTGVFYGYTLVPWFKDNGHLALSRLLGSPYIDFISCTNGAGKFTSLGEHDMHFLFETDSIQKAGKLIYYEADTRTCHSQWVSKLRPDIDPEGSYNNEGWFGPPTIEGSLELLKAVFSRVLITGSALWWFDLWGGWYDDKRILDLFAELQKIGDESLGLSRKSISQIAVIVDEKSLHYLPTGCSFNWIRSQMHEIGRIGGPYEIYLLDDLERIDLSRFRMVIFLNAFALSGNEREVIRQRYTSGDRLLLWLYAPGFINGSSISADNISSLLNMEIGMGEIPFDLDIKVKLPGKGVLTYKGAKTSPSIWVEPGTQTDYGWVSDGRAVLSEDRGRDHWNVIACVPPIPWTVIQYFAHKAGVHIFSEAGDIVYANKDYLAISAAKPGIRKIELPEEVYLKELVGSGVGFGPGKEFNIDFGEHTCRLFQIVGPKDKAGGVNNKICSRG